MLTNIHEGEFVLVPGRLFPILTPELLRIALPALVEGPEPHLVHKWLLDQLVLCVAAVPERKLLFCGTQSGGILVYSLEDCSLKTALACDGLVLCLEVSGDGLLLFSAGLDSLVHVWDVELLEVRAVIYSLADIGDIFSIRWCDLSRTLFVGTQLATLLWATLTESGTLEKLPHYRYDKFFDSKGPGGLINALQLKHALRRSLALKAEPKLIEVAPKNQIRFAHHGYIYCMDTYDQYLVTCGGDGAIHVWLPLDQMKKVATLENGELVLLMLILALYLYVGLSDLTIAVWDLMTKQQIRRLSFSRDEAPSLCVVGDYIYKALNDGLVKFSAQNYSPLATVVHLSSHALVLTVDSFSDGNKTFLVSGGALTCVWDISAPPKRTVELKPGLSNDDMLVLLCDLILCKTVSKYPELYMEDSRRCARHLLKLLTSLGAYQTQLLPVEDGNPVVYSLFRCGRPDAARVAWYGHYDVVDALSGWDSDPFTMTSVDGSLVGRGVSDNKGPTLAAIYAVAELAASNKLACDVVFLIEGEEECGSIGFQDVVKANRLVIGDIDWIMLLNSYWLDDDTPCLNYGLRGVVNALVTVKLAKPDRHSGVDGGVSREPTMDLIHVLGQLVDPCTQRIALPGFYDHLVPLTDKELALYQTIERQNIVEQDLVTLMAKWRNPSLTVHKIQVLGPNNNTVIPQLATALVSIRIVPNQEIDDIKQLLTTLLNEKFKELGSENALSVDIYYTAEPWLGDPFNHVYQVLASQIEKHWGTTPLYIREGGSIPLIRFLEKCFQAPAAQIPCGQASDNAHLQNEKLRIVNLHKLRAILTDTFQELKKPVV